MELVSPKIISGVGKKEKNINKLTSYLELKKYRPLKVDESLHIIKETENIRLFEKYIDDHLGLVPITRINTEPKSNLDFPARVLLEMTSRCNLNCYMCPRQHLTRECKDMETELFKKCIDEMDKFGIDGLWIYNIGESILHPDFPELLNYVSQKKNLGSIWHSSNGQELNEKFSKQIIESNIKYMNLSVNAITPRTYSIISPDGNWEKMISNFNQFMELKRAMGKRTPFSRVQIIDQECASQEIDQFIANYTNSADIISVNLLEAFSKNIDQNVHYAKKRLRPEKKTCHRVRRKDLFIFSNGETTFCDTDFNGIFSMGNVRESTIYEIWNSNQREEIIRLEAEGKLEEVELCKNCLDFDL